MACFSALRISLLAEKQLLPFATKRTGRRKKKKISNEKKSKKEKNIGSQRIQIEDGKVKESRNKTWKKSKATSNNKERIEAALHCVCLTFLSRGRDQPFWGVIVVQFILIELKPVRRVNAECGRQPEQISAQSMSGYKRKLTLNKGEFRVAPPIMLIAELP